jgi:serine/threonine protein kinase/WD40 repeat protein
MAIIPGDNSGENPSLLNVSAERHPVDVLAEEFLARFRRGERPSLEDYVERYPELAEDIRDLFPALVMMENVRPGEGTSLGAEAQPLGGQPKLERLGDYRVLRVVGRGGMGIVYEAEQESLGRHVALKVLPGQSLLDPQRLERFQREARAAARLHHTNIVPVFGVGEHEGLHYYVMQFIQGLGLDQVVDELKRLRHDKAAPSAPRQGQQLTALWAAQSVLTGRFATDPAKEPTDENGAKSVSSLVVAASAADSSTTMRLTGAADQPTLSEPGPSYWQSIARIGLQVTQALHYAHQQGLLHRDIKPSNLLLDTRGTVWVTDFGLAKSADSNDLTGTGDIVGTMRYMAPERFGGKSDGRSDLYSLGMTLYELVTLQPAFGGEDRQQLFQQVLRIEPPLPRKICRDVPRDLETIILTAIAKDPQLRYQTAEAMAEDLQRFLTDRPIRARRSAVWERSWRWCRRNPLVASLLGLVGMLLVSVAVISTISSLQLAQALVETQKAERQARLDKAEALVGEAYGIRNSRRPGQRFDALKALGKAAAIGRELGQPPSWFNRLRNEAIAALALPDIHITQEFDGFPPGTNSVGLSDDFEWYAQTTKQGGCTVRRVADNSIVVQLPELGEPAQVEFGRGRCLVLHGESSWCLQLWDLSGDVPILRVKEERVHFWHVRPDGKLLGMAHENGSISVYDLSGARVQRLEPAELDDRLRLVLHPTEPFIAVNSYMHRLVLVRDWRSGAVVARFQAPWRGSGGFAWSPDGRTLAVPDGDHCKIQLLSFDPKAPGLLQLRLLEGPEMGGCYVSYNPAGDRLVARGWHGVVQLFDPAYGFLFSTHASPIPSYWQDVRFDRTGQRLAAARVGEREEQIGLWSVADAREYRALKHTGKDLWDVHIPALHPPGRLVAVAHTEGVALFDVENGQTGEMPMAGSGACSAFDGQGNLLTNGNGGFYRWPVRADPGKSGHLTIGPPERLPFEKGNRQISASANGRVIAQSMWMGYGMEKYAGGWILHPDVPKPRRVLADTSADSNSVSRDGKWVAFAGPHMNVKVYDAKTGECVWQLPAGDFCFSRFSPDGHWLLTNVDGGRVYAAGTWKPAVQLGSGTPWDVSADGSLAVLGQTNGIYRLVEFSSGRELARLEDPEQNSGRAAFTPDGAKLVVTAKNGLRVWDLRRIRQELAKLKLDWDAPPYPPALAGKAPVPLNIKIIASYVEQARAEVNAGRFHEAKVAFEKALAAEPEDALAQNNFAWLLATCPDAKLREPARAVELAQRAVKLKAKAATYWNTLGVAQYRKKDYKEAIDSLNKSTAMQGENAVDGFFLAMAHWKLGQKKLARKHYDHALADMEKRLPALANDAHHTDELRRSQAEAAEVLGIEKTK